MDELFAFVKKTLIWTAVIIGAIWFASSRISLDDCLDYAAKNPHKPSSEKIAYYVGAVHYYKSRYPEAIRAYDQVLTDFPTGQYAPRALYRKGFAHQNMRQWDKAREAYERYLKDYPEGKQLDLAKKKYEYVKFK